MFKFDPKSLPPAGPPQTKYERHKSRMADKSRQKAAAVREIGVDFPKRRNRKQKAAALKSLAVFCRTYFPDIFALPFSKDHHRFLASLERAVLHGESAAVAMARGSGKTAMCVAGVTWAVLRGSIRFAMLIAASKEAACELLLGIKTQLETNDHLLADFPEVCYPIRRLEGINQRKLLFHGEPIKMKFTADQITFPDRPGGPAASATIGVAGITGRIRGRKITLPDGKEVRPSLCVVDDPQDDESAHSPSQNQRREKIIKGSIMGMAGPGQPLAVAVTCTVIAPDDLADRLLDRQRNPEFHGFRTSLVYKWPEGDRAEFHWSKYREIQEESMRLDLGPDAENDYYLANRVEMDEGAEVAWPERFRSTEHSAIQHAYNLRFASPDTFDAEYQNRPRRPEDEDPDILTPAKICARINGLKRRAVPIEAQFLTVFIDVQGALLFYAVQAFAPDFHGGIVDYGSWPRQSGKYWTLAKARRTLATEYPAVSLETQLTQGLTALSAELASTRWTRADGTDMTIARTLVDANWGASTDTVYAFCASPAGRAINAIPSHGRFVGASSNAMADWQKKPGDLVGTNWKIPALSVGRQIRHVVWDTNFWKSAATARMSIPAASRGALTLFGDDSDLHRMFADHLTAEYRVRTTARGRTVDEWKQKPNQPDNHWFDCVVGGMVAGSIAGASLTVAPAQPTKRRRRGFKYS